MPRISTQSKNKWMGEWFEDETVSSVAAWNHWNGMDQVVSGMEWERAWKGPLLNVFHMDACDTKFNYYIHYN